MHKRSAILWADQLPNISYLLLHGQQDDRVEPDQSVRMAAALQSASITDVTLRLFPDGDHMLVDVVETVDSEILDWMSQRRIVVQEI